MSKKDKEKDNQPDNNLAQLREARRLITEEKRKAKQFELDQREEFRKFFAKTKEKLKINSNMEHILWLHLSSSGFAEKSKFEDGLKHFGYKI